MAKKDNNNNADEKERQQQFASWDFKNNEGAAYTAATGDLFGGMSLVYRDKIREIPEVGLIWGGAVAYKTASDSIYQKRLDKYSKSLENYNEKLEKWGEDKNKGKKTNKPRKPKEPDMPAKEEVIKSAKGLDYAHMHLMDLQEAANARAGIFYRAYGNMSIKTARELIFGENYLPEGTPKKIKQELDDKKDEIIGKLSDGIVKETALSLVDFHVRGNVARNIQEIKLVGKLESLVREQEENNKEEEK